MLNKLLLFYSVLQFYKTKLNSKNSKDINILLPYLLTLEK